MADAQNRFSLGFDFGTESVRVLVVDIFSGRVAAQTSAAYAHGVIDEALPADAGGAGEKLPADYALQHPQDWLDALAEACRAAVRQSGVGGAGDGGGDAGGDGGGGEGAGIEKIVGIGVDFTSCTMLPCRADGTPLCLDEAFRSTPMAWPKLWKHHAAKAQTQRLNDIARERGEPWLARYGGSIGLEWFFPKMLETLELAPQVYAAANFFLEAGDWLVWQLTSGPFPRCDAGKLVRSTCQAGYKAQWNSRSGYPSREYFRAVDERLENVVAEKMRGDLCSPGAKAGSLTAASAELLGLREGIPVSAAIIDAHAGVAGAGVASPSTMVLVLGTSSCHMMNSRTEMLTAGVAGVVEDGILPGYFGYETGQASVGDAFAWLVDTFHLSHDALAREAAKLPPGSGGVLAIDWFNGCRTPLMDANLSGAFLGLTLSTKPEQLYRALIEATAFGVRWIVETLRESGVPVRRFVASGGLPGKNPLLMQIYADVLNEKLGLAQSDQSVALGAAILGCLAAGEAVTGYAQVSQAIHAMARQREDLVYRPDLKARKEYDGIYALYRKVTNPSGAVAAVMREMRGLNVER